ncbi:MAG: methylenetetrahydrofolate reductase, partial [Leadbetterella sp.]
MAKVVDLVSKTNFLTPFSIEIIPPTKGSNIASLLQDITPMMEIRPAFVDVTYHREEYISKQAQDGSILEVKTRKRPGTVGICAAIMHKFKVDTVPHILCGGTSKEATEDLLIDLNYLGIENVLALRGDHAKPFDSFKPHKEGHTYASDLIGQIKNMNQGKFLHEEENYLSKTNFCIGGAAYPEKHFEAIDSEIDFENLRKKVEAGAEFLVTQMFFDNSKYFKFVEKCKQNGIAVPIIPGIKVLSTRKQIDTIPSLFYLNIPKELRGSILACKDDKDAKQVG